MPANNPPADFPTSLHERTNVVAFNGTPLGDSTPTQTDIMGKVEEEIYQIQRKIGIGESSAESALAGEIWTADGLGGSSWQAPGAPGDIDAGILEALTEKVGGGTPTTPNAGEFLVGTDTGESAWRAATSADVGLDQVDNTADADKPISDATQTALDGKEDVATPVTLTDAATIAVNAALGREFRVTLTASRTMGNPSNLVDGQRLLFRIEQGGSGSYTVTWSSKYRFSTDVPSPTLSTTVGAADFVFFNYNAGDDKLDCLGWARGY